MAFLLFSSGREPLLKPREEDLGGAAPKPSQILLEKDLILKQDF